MPTEDKAYKFTAVMLPTATGFVSESQLYLSN